jgi:hypothetical protein
MSPAVRIHKSRSRAKNSNCQPILNLSPLRRELSHSSERTKSSGEQRVSPQTTRRRPMYSQRSIATESQLDSSTDSRIDDDCVFPCHPLALQLLHLVGSRWPGCCFAWRSALHFIAFGFFGRNQWLGRTHSASLCFETKLRMPEFVDVQEDVKPACQYCSNWTYAQNRTLHKADLPRVSGARESTPLLPSQAMCSSG